MPSNLMMGSRTMQWERNGGKSKGRAGGPGGGLTGIRDEEG